ncbi:TonB-dependent vitamin B12 receptor [Thiorhodovibrio frisius]|uniref:TonB-dependent vitamin B12 receptor n=1 Tax=Thiorhodovibrio frisius TaxID=631362 RepID=H8Z3V2_9GAMM|nr:TonB-dependent vitamin B12 receptor [Thiorhodovibrio frisius]EIC21104.1 TonB-dependent vitamin B12 receptor [Thiorhodovibrio frisius]WPL22164.1 Outer membrane cobalamin translocator [Thiorhodovibrio frisius]
MTHPLAGFLRPAALVIGLPSTAMLSAAALAAVEDVTNLDPIVVTATRMPETTGETLASVTVIDRADIDRRQSRTMTDILRGLPGVGISSNGGPGQPTSVFLRGTESDHTLVLIDGVKVGSATLGTVPWQDIPVEQIERIEVVRGPRSSLYGSEAIGGVIQIFTRKGGGEATAGPLKARVSAGAGTYGTVEGHLGLSGSSGSAWFDAGLGFERSEGFNACDGEPLVGGCFVNQPDRDGYRNDNGSLRAGYRFSDVLEADVNFLRAASENDYDGSAFAGDASKGLLQVAGINLTLQPLANWSSKLSLARSWDDSTIYFDDDEINHYDTRRDILSWLNRLSLGAGQQLGLGLDYQLDVVDTDPSYATDSRRNLGVFGEYLGAFGPQDWQLSLRHDDNEQFGGHTTGSIAWGYRLPNRLRVTASLGTAFKAPTFNELYYPGFGNPDLEPETAQSAELGLSGPHPWGDWGLSLYQTEIEDLIAYDGSTFAPANLDSARIRGIELWSVARIADWDLDANLTLLDPRNTSPGADHGKLLARRPEQSLRLDADRRFGRVGLGGTLTLEGRRYDDFANQTQLDGFALLDLRAEYAFSRSLLIQGRVENVFNEDYETAAFYNQPGRSFFVTLRYAP